MDKKANSLISIPVYNRLVKLAPIYIAYIVALSGALKVLIRISTDNLLFSIILVQDACNMEEHSVYGRPEIDVQKTK